MIYGKMVYKGRIIEAGIEFEGEFIKKIGKLVKGRKVDGIILPAGIDVHVHLRDFREKHKETIESGTLSALFGGMCLVVDQPNTKPVVDNKDIYERRIKIAEKDSYVDYALNLALTRKNSDKILDIVSDLRKKYYLPAVGEVFIQHSDENMQISYDLLRKIKLDLMTIHAEDPDYVSDGLPNFMYRKREAEIKAVKECLKIGNFHFCHISTKEAAELILNSNSTFEVTPHHLLLTVEDYDRLNGFVNVNPPLRSKDEAGWLLANIDKVDVLASDHAPHTPDEKISGAPGFPGVETMYPVFVNFVFKGLLSLETLIEKIAVNPAKIFGFRHYGAIEVGKYANLAVFNPKNKTVIKADKLHSLCGWTPYEGFEAVFPEKVYIRGKEALADTFVKCGSILKPNDGRTL